MIVGETQRESEKEGGGGGAQFCGSLVTKLQQKKFVSLIPEERERESIREREGECVEHFQLQVIEKMNLAKIRFKKVYEGERGFPTDL